MIPIYTQKQGHFLHLLESNVRLEAYKEASDFCAAKGKRMRPLSANAVDSGYAKFAQAEVMFTCESSNTPGSLPQLDLTPNPITQDLVKSPSYNNQYKVNKSGSLAKPPRDICLSGNS